MKETPQNLRRGMPLPLQQFPAARRQNSYIRNHTFPEPPSRLLMAQDSPCVNLPLTTGDVGEK